MRTPTHLLISNTLSIDTISKQRQRQKTTINARFNVLPPFAAVQQLSKEQTQASYSLHRQLLLEK